MQDNPKSVLLCVCHHAGDSLQRLPKDPPVRDGGVSLRVLLSDRGSGGCGSLSASQRHHRDQTPQQHVHVPCQPGPQAHLPRQQVRTIKLIIIIITGKVWSNPDPSCDIVGSM